MLFQKVAFFSRMLIGIGKVIIIGQSLPKNAYRYRINSNSILSLDVPVQNRYGIEPLIPVTNYYITGTLLKSDSGFFLAFWCNF
jgi:hypothetical protein